MQTLFDYKQRPWTRPITEAEYDAAVGKAAPTKKSNPPAVRKPTKVNNPHGCKQLCAAILQQALEDLTNPKAKRQAAAEAARHNAIAFLNGQGSFGIVCEALGLDPASFSASLRIKHPALMRQRAA